MSNQNIGYRLGILVKNFKNWKYPVWVKIACVLITGLVLYSLQNIVAIILTIVCIGLALYLMHDTNGVSSEELEESVISNIKNYKFSEYKCGPDGYGLYCGSRLISTEEEE
ncbi:hypothetical protein [Caviibacterium pharyngocola]|uniref:DUF3742 domain-containing protein n=1 Tax=Caviibacterium pharyngocola TaxID=28159 RepID=A0A2M8RV71_9PAST|nr:hypothetical protein [Caviibacterium pharyngocola]PJG82787.1 hypothetical protein CVP04_07435 [Caviibacterium pharyngocola]